MSMTTGCFGSAFASRRWQASKISWAFSPSSVCCVVALVDANPSTSCLTNCAEAGSVSASPDATATAEVRKRFMTNSLQEHPAAGPHLMNSASDTPPLSAPAQRPSFSASLFNPLEDGREYDRLPCRRRHNRQRLERQDLSVHLGIAQACVVPVHSSFHDSV